VNWALGSQLLEIVGVNIFLTAGSGDSGLDNLKKTKSVLMVVRCRA